MSNLITRNGKPNVIRGGIARQFAPGLFYMSGRTHAGGGIDIGKNPRTGVEVEDGEVVQLNKNGMRVFSAMPFLTGESPASLVANGADPDIVFAAQENFKDRFGINDDGTTAQTGGQYKPGTIYGRPIEKGLEIVSPEFDILTLGRLIGNSVGKSAINSLQNLPTAKERIAATNKAFKERAVDYKTAMNLSKEDIVDGIKNKNLKYVYTGVKDGIKATGAYLDYLVDTPTRYLNNYLETKSRPYARMIKHNYNMFKNLLPSEFLDDKNEKKMGGIHIDKNKRGTFTAAATKHGMGVQEFASRVLANKEDYSPAMVKKANFARNASRWKKAVGGDTPIWKNRVGIVTTRGFVPNSISGYSGGQGGGGGASTPFYHIPQKYEEINKDTLFIPYRETFNDAFARAKRQGLDNFVFDGKTYTTEMSDNPNWRKVGDSRVVECIIPIITERKKINYKKAGGIVSVNGNIKNGLVYTCRAKAPMGDFYPIIRTKNGYITSGGYVPVDNKIDIYNGQQIEEPQYRIEGQGPVRSLVRGIPIKLDDGRGFYTITDRPAERVLGVRGFDNLMRVPNFTELENARTAINDWNNQDTPDFENYTPRNNRTVAVARNVQPAADTPVWDDIFNETVIGERPAVSPRTGRLSDNYKLTIPDRIIRGGEITPPEYRADITNGYIDGNFDGEVSKDRQPETDTTGGGFNLKDPAIIGAGINMLGSLGSYLINRNILNKAKPRPTNVRLTAQKLKTRYNINPQLDELREQAAANNRLINNNTASSRTALGRMNLINTALGRSRAELYGNKENRETELINQDILNSQGVRNQEAVYNAQLRADYQNRLDDFNRLRLANNNALFSGLTGGVNSIVDSLLRQRYYNNTIGAIGARNPNVDARIFRDAGVDWSFMYPYSTRNRR